ncbi:unnamed protein product, partial [Schistosoma turkestanicum]
ESESQTVLQTKPTPSSSLLLVQVKKPTTAIPSNTALYNIINMVKPNKSIHPLQQNDLMTVEEKQNNSCSHKIIDQYSNIH